MMIIAVIGIVLLGTVAGPLMSNVETPNYEVLEQKNKIEIRQYQPMIIAEVQVDGKREDAVGDGFRLLADYIFGNNIVEKDIEMTAPVQQQESTKIKMTAPVQQQESTKIEMTAPVQQQKSTKIPMTAPVQQQSTSGTWKVSFVMPSEYKMATLPKPVNEQVTLKEVPAKTFVAIRFSGRGSDKNIKKHEAKLMAYIASNKLEVTSSPKYAFYNAPWTLPILRRNEVMVELKL